MNEITKTKEFLKEYKERLEYDLMQYKVIGSNDYIVAEIRIFEIKKCLEFLDKILETGYRIKENG